MPIIIIIRGPSDDSVNGNNYYEVAQVRLHYISHIHSGDTNSITAIIVAHTHAHLGLTR